jgi:integrase
VVKRHRRFGVSHTDHNLKQQVAKSNRKERLEDRIQITDKQVREILHQHSASDDVFDNLIALQLATGSRFIEATRLSAFKPSSRDGWVKIIGIAKKKEDNVEMERPILGLDLEEVLEIVKKIRKELKKKYPQFETLDNDDLTKLLINRVNTRIKKMGIEGVETSHTLRKLYANMSYKLLSQDERRKIDQHQFVQNVLGHASIDTSASYTNVKINKGGNKIQNHKDVERKFDMVDSKDEQQDRQIENLENKVGAERGGAVERAKKIMDELHAKGIHITEKLLKTEYNIGSKTISALKDYKKALNDSLKN